MSKDWKVKETGASCKLVFVSTDNPVKKLWEKLRNQAKLDKIEKNWYLCFVHILSAIAAFRTRGTGLHFQAGNRVPTTDYRVYDS